LTVSGDPYRITPVLYNEDKPSVTERVLEPLTKGKTVALEIRDPRMAKKSRVKKKVLLIVPIESGKYVLVAVPGYGAEMLDVTKKIKGIDIYRIGISMTLSSSLAEALNELF
jgi:hypothetical protein